MQKLYEFIILNIFSFSATYNSIYKTLLKDVFRGVFRTQSNIYDGAFCKNSWRLKAVNFFTKSSILNVLIHVLTNISRIKNNQTMKFCLVIKYNMINIFLEKSYPKCGGETIPRSFPKMSKLSISLEL